MLPGAATMTKVEKARRRLDAAIERTARALLKVDRFEAAQRSDTGVAEAEISSAQSRVESALHLLIKFRYQQLYREFAKRQLDKPKSYRKHPR